ncbi:MAG: 4-hydroxybenzoate octaprenyltransferase [Candidatus Latescibacteria bacterium]|nr:4-hydroxybenzoate octaprenyltransferase [Candidatus Latescibacterota bacterium]NIM22686.1 4-hydroxybenzoate octaprenyltransferase [Candidatus Latescibacterota bacterium]NIM64975.1 4-hydroxybenzoate octaprenyltransferase [Candidatus Latescibacterota bacterium]NIO01490.1 4-hydroxybenzoate octaprenyltransferase [Candidatus Latescibacterota bacterium]NIO28000.1 4-hydroxybenzoate octaprenyltransferase [Candidatus Latescibacterota bacterium]
MMKIKEFLETIKYEHTIFALPFAYLTLFLAESGWPSLHNFVWVTLAMVSGRTIGMGANRLIDAEIDARNPRTAERALAAGRISKKQTLVFIIASLAMFLVSVYRLSPWSEKLWPIVIIVMILYPYTKRLTSISHLALGLVYLMIPTGVWIAVTNTLTLPSFILAVSAAFWVAGFDVIYSCQDVEIDRKQGLHSIPADIGIQSGLWISRLFHLVFVAALLWAGVLLDVGALYYIGVAITALLIAYEHSLVAPSDLSRVNAAFFTTNGIISIVLFIFVAVDALV